MKPHLIAIVLSAFVMSSCAKGPSPSVDQPSRQSTPVVEADPPIKRWQVLKSLTETAFIDIICYPEYTEITSEQRVAEIVRLLQDSKNVTGPPSSGPDLKVYFRRADGSFIMAARVHPKDHILSSPEGPIIQTSPRVVEYFLADGVCTPER